jgi:hypothetical protein
MDDDIINRISWGGMFGATITVLVTTLDDSIWLLPFVGTASLPMEARVVNAVTFLSTLMGLSIFLSLVAIAIKNTVSTKTELESEKLEVKLDFIAAIFCWILAALIYFKKWLKKRLRQLEREDAAWVTTDDQGKFRQGNYGTLSQVPSEEPEEDNGKPGQPCTVFSLTTLGFLDEISYFPALIVGDIFTVWELCIGTALSGMIMLGIQVFVAAQFQPLIEWLDDHVKLHHIISVFATILTIQLIWDMTHLDDD